MLSAWLLITTLLFPPISPSNLLKIEVTKTVNLIISPTLPVTIQYQRPEGEWISDGTYYKIHNYSPETMIEGDSRDYKIHLDSSNTLNFYTVDLIKDNEGIIIDYWSGEKKEEGEEVGDGETVRWYEPNIALAVIRHKQLHDLYPELSIRFNLDIKFPDDDYIEYLIDSSDWQMDCSEIDKIESEIIEMDDDNWKIREDASRKVSMMDGRSIFYLHEREKYGLSAEQLSRVNSILAEHLHLEESDLEALRLWRIEQLEQLD